MREQFLVAHARGNNVSELVCELLNQVDSNSLQANLGILYATDYLAHEISPMLENIRSHLNVNHWVGTVGMGICCNGEEIYDQPAVVMMLAQMENIEMLNIATGTEDINKIPVRLNINPDVPSLAVIHGNPSEPQFPSTLQELSSLLSSTFFVGGLTSSSSVSPQIVNNYVANSLISGFIVKESSRIVVGHTQGCTPIEQKHEITRCKNNLVLELDHRPAVEVFKEDIGEVLAQALESNELSKIAGYIFAGFPVESSDTSDYLVRNIIGIDKSNSVLAIGDYVEEGQSMMFCRRDGNSATEDMHRMLNQIRDRLQHPAKGALYYSCVARGRNQFGENSTELKMIQQALSDLPLIGFFANGEIFHNRLYGYTGVLTVFT